MYSLFSYLPISQKISENKRMLYSIIFYQEIFEFFTDEELTFVQGNKGSIYPQLVARNYIYYRYRGSLPNEHYWKCSLYDRGLCKARCTTYNDCVEYYGTHTHPPDYDRITNRIVVSKIKVKVKKCVEGEIRAPKGSCELPSYMRLPEKERMQLSNLPNFNFVMSMTEGLQKIEPRNLNRSEMFSERSLVDEAPNVSQLTNFTQNSDFQKTEHRT